MSRADDLASIFARSLNPPPGTGVRQGIVVSFDVFTALSVVNVAGALIENVPLISPAGQVFLKAGDPVLILKYGASWAILGRVVNPQAGAYPAIGRYYEASAGYAGSTAVNYALTTSFVTRCSLAIQVPVWAEVATVSATLYSQAFNSTGADDLAQYRVLFPDAAATTWTGPTTPTNDWASFTLPATYSLLVTPGGTLTIEGQIRTINAGWAINANNGSFLGATVQWNSNDGP